MSYDAKRAFIKDMIRCFPVEYGLNGYIASACWFSYSTSRWITTYMYSGVHPIQKIYFASMQGLVLMLVYAVKTQLHKQ